MSAPACPESASKDGEAWRRHIIRQLKLRDRFQKIRFQDVIRACTVQRSGVALIRLPPAPLTDVTPQAHADLLLRKRPGPEDDHGGGRASATACTNVV
uniref:Uncharacterized protein n=1 Tax=Denticeps clupeoides TaxID=299321 RepID=A0AAY4B0F1_9TELE